MLAWKTLSLLLFTLAGILTIAIDALFSGARDVRFFALDARTGAELWKPQPAGAVYSGAMSDSLHAFAVK